MRVLVAYASQYGATKGIAERIADKLHERGLEVDLRSADDLSGSAIDRYDAFVIGSAIHAGHWLRPAVDFARHNATVLAAQPSWLFSSGPIGETSVHKPQPDPAEISELRSKLDVQNHVVFAGAFDPATVDEARTNWLERTLVKKFIPVGDFRDWPLIEAWAIGIARHLAGVLQPV